MFGLFGMMDFINLFFRGFVTVSRYDGTSWTETNYWYGNIIG